MNDEKTPFQQWVHGVVERAYKSDMMSEEMVLRDHLASRIYEAFSLEDSVDDSIAELLSGIAVDVFADFAAGVLE